MRIINQVTGQFGQAIGGQISAFVSGPAKYAQNTISNVTGAVNNLQAQASKAIDSVASSLNPSAIRQKISGLLPGGKSSNPAATPRMALGSLNSAGGEQAQETSMAVDWRVKISLTNASTLFYLSSDAGIMQPLEATGGVIFPYTPNITFQHMANYEKLEPVHSNYPYYFYKNSEVRQIEVAGDFTVQNIDEGAYVLAAVYFFRALTKMFYGESGYVGNPPPLVYLKGYGANYIDDVPCVVTGFLHTMPDSVDYMPIPFPTTSLDPQSKTWVPMHSQLQISLQPVYSRERVSKFNLEKYASGGMLKGERFL